MRGNGTAVWSRQSGGGDEGDCLFGYVLKPDRCSETRYPNIQKLDLLAHLKTATSSVVSDLHYYSLSSPLFPPRVWSVKLLANEPCQQHSHLCSPDCDCVCWCGRSAGCLIKFLGINLMWISVCLCESSLLPRHGPGFPLWQCPLVSLDALHAALQSPGEAASAEVVHVHVGTWEEEDHQGHDHHGAGTATPLLQLHAVERPKDCL